MKKYFKWAIPLEDSEIKRILREGIISFDANVLLDLHRLHESGMKELKNAISLCGDRAWLTNQAADEYIDRYREVDNEARSFFDSCWAEFQKIEARGIEILNKFRQSHQTNNVEVKTRLESLQKELRDFIASMKDKCDEHGKVLKDLPQRDDIFNWVMEYFNGKTGAPFPSAKLETVKQHGKKRYEENVPPGYMDRQKPEGKRYGDYIIWLQLQEKAREEKKDIVFVTRDEKEDWFHIERGKKTPLNALLKEFHDKTEGQTILIYRSAYFLEKFLPIAERSTTLSPTALEAIEEINNLSDYGLTKPRFLLGVEQTSDMIFEADFKHQVGAIEFRVNREMWRIALNVESSLLKDHGFVIDGQYWSSPDFAPPFNAVCRIDSHHEMGIVLRPAEDRPFPEGNYILFYRVGRLNQASRRTRIF